MAARVTRMVAQILSVLMVLTCVNSNKCHKIPGFSGEDGVNESCSVLETTVTCWGNYSITAETVQMAGTFDRYTTAIVLPGIVRIGEGAFKRCTSLVSVSLPDGLLYVEAEAFANCHSLKSITFPSSVISLAETATNSCNQLSHVQMSGNATYKSYNGFIFDSNGDLFMAGPARCSGAGLLLPAVNKILANAVRWNQAIKVTIRAVTTEVKKNAFYACDMVTLVIGKKVETFNMDGLNSCSSLLYIQLNSDNYLYVDGNISAGDNYSIFGARNDNDKPKSIIWISPLTTNMTIASTIKEISGTALQACTLLKSVKCDSSSYKLTCDGQLILRKNSTSSKWDIVFACVGGATELAFTSNITTIDGSALKGIQYLKKVTLHRNVARFGSSGIRMCPELHTVDFKSCTMANSKGAAEMPKLLFASCRKLTTFLNWPQNNFIMMETCLAATGIVTLSVPSQVTEIWDGALSTNSDLVEVTLPSTLTYLGKQAFNKCPKLKHITFTLPSSLTYLGQMAFAHCTSLVDITLPSTITTLVPGCFAADTSLVSILFENNDGAYVSDGVSAYEKKDGNKFHTIVVCPAGLTDINIHPDTKVIGSQSFYGCDKLVNVTMSNGIKVVERSAFFECNAIKFVRLTASITYIGARAFESCKELEMILYCSNRDEVDFSEGDPFPTNPAIYLWYDFPNTTFCGHECFAILDHQCNIPTQSFTEYISDMHVKRVHRIFPVFTCVAMALI